MNESQKSCQIRVFISSTFRDFAEERDLLVKKIFPELRRRCRCLWRWQAEADPG